MPGAQLALLVVTAVMESPWSGLVLGLKVIKLGELVTAGRGPLQEVCPSILHIGDLIGHVVAHVGVCADPSCQVTARCPDLEHSLAPDT